MDEYICLQCGAVFDALEAYEDEGCVACPNCHSTDIDLAEEYDDQD